MGVKVYINSCLGSTIIRTGAMGCAMNALLANYTMKIKSDTKFPEIVKRI